MKKHAFLFTLLSVLSASATTVDATGYTRSIDLSVSGYTGSSTLTNFPVLVRLGPSVAGFRYADFASPDGGDLVFTDGTGNVIPHEIDTWNTNGESLVWVKLPLMAKNTPFRAYWGRLPDAPNDPTAVWSGYVGVWHMGEDSGNAIDATGHGYDGVPSGDLASGMVAYQDGAVGRARVNASQSSGQAWLELSGSSTISLQNRFSVSGWIRANAVGNSCPRIVSRKVVYTDKNGWEVELYFSPTNINMRGASNVAVNSIVPNTAENWVHMTAIYDGTTATLYANGVQSGSGTIAAPTDNNLPIYFGNRLEKHLHSMANTTKCA